ncbi:MAG: F0F1 ATP synthase subunit B [Gemmataceae bacterium]
MRAFSTVILLGLGFLLGSGSVMAEVKSGPDSEGLAHAVPKGDFEPFGWSVDLALFAFLIFGGLILVLQRFAWKPIMEALTDRENALQKVADDAAKARTDAAALRGELDEKFAQAGDQVRQMVEEARRDGQALREEILGRAREEIAAERDRMTRELETAKDQALLEISLRSIKLSGLLTAKVLGKQISEADHARLLDEAIVDLDQTMAVTGAR